MFSENIDLTVAKTFALASPKGDVGIEIETEGRDLPGGRVTQTFQGKEDGSLRNGMEYVSKPIAAKIVTEVVNNLAAALVHKGAGVDPSYRSSTHIHVNYCDYRWRDVLGTMVAWAVLEPVVFSMMPPGRDGSLFCVSSYDSGDLPNYMERLCTEISNSFGMGFHPRGKYSSLNLTRLSDLGTLEYRVFPTSMNGAQVQTWVNWLMNIRDHVQKQDDPSFLTMVREAEQQPLPFLERIFGTSDIPQAQEYVDFGARQGFEIARVIHKHLKAPAPKKKAAGKSLFVENAIGRRGEIEPGIIVGGANFAEVAPAQPVADFQRARRGAGRGNQEAGRPNGGDGEVPGAGDPVERVDAQIRRWQNMAQAYRLAGNNGMVEMYERRIRRRQAQLEAHGEAW